MPPEYISFDGLPGLGGCSLICNDDGAGDWTTNTYFSHYCIHLFFYLSNKLKFSKKKKTEKE